MLDTYYSKEKYADLLSCWLRLLVLCPSSPSPNPSYGRNATAAFGYTYSTLHCKAGYDVEKFRDVS